MIRAVGEFHSLSPPQQEPANMTPTPIDRSTSLSSNRLSKAPGLMRSTTVGASGFGKSTRPQLPKSVVTPADDELHNVKNALNTVDEYHATVVETLEVNARLF